MEKVEEKADRERAEKGRRGRVLLPHVKATGAQLNNLHNESSDLVLSQDTRRTGTTMTADLPESLNNAPRDLK